MAKLIKIFLTVSSLFFFLYSALGQEITIQGSVKSIKEGHIIVWALTAKGNDTLCIAPINNEKFKAVINTIPSPQMSRVSVAGHMGFTPMVLENKKNYKIHLRPNEVSSIESNSPLQQIFTNYQELITKYNREITKQKDKIQQATLEKKFRTVSTMKSNLNKLREDAHHKLDSIINDNKDNVLGTYLLTTPIDKVTDITELQKIYRKISPKALQTEPAKILKRRIKILSGIKINSKAPNFKLPDKDGKLHSLYDKKGDIFILDFWASWCGPCRKENPNMVVLYDKFNKKGLQIISISIDKSEKKWLDAIKKDRLEWLQLIANRPSTEKFLEIYNVINVPTILILDKDKNIIAKNIRNEKLRIFIEKQLKVDKK